MALKVEALRQKAVLWQRMQGMQGMQGLQIKADYDKGGSTKNATLKTEDAEDAEAAQNKLKSCFESQSFETKSCSMAEDAGDAKDAKVANKNRFCLGWEHQESYFKTRGCGGWRGCKGF